jgi:hypothetical protein
MPTISADSPAPRAWFFGTNQFQQRAGLAVSFWAG